MASHTFWKGYLKLSLVTCPVTMRPATSEADKVRFHVLNAKTGNRVISRYVDAETGKPIDEDDEVKGYPLDEDGKHVLLEDEEIEAVALDSTHTLDIDMFVPSDAVPWVYYDKPHYLLPSDPVGEEAFAVIREAMASTETVGISRLVLYRRERAVLLEPRGKGIVVWTLRYGDEVRPDKDYFDKIDNDKIEAEAMKLIKELIDKKTVPWDPDMVSDPVQEKLLDIISAKKKKRKAPAKAKAKTEEKPSNVVNIMDALRKSVASEKAGKSR